MTVFLYKGLIVMLPTQNSPGDPVVKQAYQVDSFVINQDGSVSVDFLAMDQ